MAFLFIEPVQAVVLDSTGSQPPNVGWSNSRSVTIAADSGGSVVDYAIKMFQMREAGTKVRFTGRCDSACTLFLALPAKQTCVDEGAYFRFHSPQASTSRDIRVAQTFLLNKYPGWVRQWLKYQGGLSEQLKTMDYAYVRQFMPTCSSITLLQ
eukprot:gene1602-1863_t